MVIYATNTALLPRSSLLFEKDKKSKIRGLKEAGFLIEKMSFSQLCAVLQNALESASILDPKPKRLFMALHQFSPNSHSTVEEDRELSFCVGNLIRRSEKSDTGSGMKTIPIKGICLLAIVAFPTWTQAELVWQKKQIEVEAIPKEPIVLANFEFTNAGKKPVSILGIETSCGCTTATVKRKTYAPGEKGKVEVQFKVQEQRGIQHKILNVTTDDPTASSVILSLDVNILQYVSLQPVFLTWQKSESAENKLIDVKLASNYAARAVTVTSSNMAIEAKVIQHDDKFQILVRPKVTSASAVATLKVTVEGADGVAHPLVAVAKVF